MSNGQAISDAARYLRASRSVVVFTGAGISAESGIATFRDDEGLWQRFPAERFATWSGLTKTAVADPGLFAEFLIAVLGPVAAAQPNAAHLALAELERLTRVTIVTQNVDGLHQAAGSTVVHEIHGSLFEIVTLSGRFVRFISRPEMQGIVERLRGATSGPLAMPKILTAIRPMLGLGLLKIHRPKVVLFGDAMAEPAWTLAQKAARECDCLITVGTSGMVMPSALLPGMARSTGATVIGVDLEAADADVNLIGPAAKLLPALVKEAFG